MGYFFSDAEDHSISITRKAFIQHNEKRPHSSVKGLSLRSTNLDDKLSATVMEWSRGVISTIAEHGKHNEITAYVIEGSLELSCAGEKEVLEEGDCAVLSTSRTVFGGARGASGCRALVVKVHTAK
jgi:hypothetical protein